MTIDTINVLAVPVDATLVSEWLRSMKLSRLVSSEVIQDAEYERKRRAALAGDGDAGDPMGWLQSIWDNLHVVVRNVHIRFEDARVSDPARWFSIGLTLAEASLRGSNTAVASAAPGGSDTAPAPEDNCGGAGAFVSRSSTRDAIRRSGSLAELAVYWDWADATGGRGHEELARLLLPDEDAAAPGASDNAASAAARADAKRARHDKISCLMAEIVGRPHNYVLKPLSLALNMEENDMSVALETQQPRRLVAVAPFSLRLRVHRAQLECAIRATSHWSLLRQSAAAIESAGDRAAFGAREKGDLRTRYIALWTRRRGAKRAPDGDTRYAPLTSEVR